MNEKTSLVYYFRNKSEEVPRRGMIWELFLFIERKIKLAIDELDQRLVLLANKTSKVSRKEAVF